MTRQPLRPRRYPHHPVAKKSGWTAPKLWWNDAVQETLDAACAERGPGQMLSTVGVMDLIYRTKAQR